MAQMQIKAPEEAASEPEVKKEEPKLTSKSDL
jgi:hypothetical protein